LNLIVGSQAAAPTRTWQIESQSSQHNTVALAPYFGILDTWDNDAAIFYPLYARAQQDIRANGWVSAAQEHLAAAGQATKLAIYEINFHTTSPGTVPLDLRNRFVAGLGGGLALPLFMLTYQQEMGIRDQAQLTTTGQAMPIQLDDLVISNAPFTLQTEQRHTLTFLLPGDLRTGPSLLRPLLGYKVRRLPGCDNPAELVIVLNDHRIAQTTVEHERLQGLWEVFPGRLLKAQVANTVQFCLLHGAVQVADVVLWFRREG
jgi:hypothetical protein